MLFKENIEKKSEDTLFIGLTQEKAETLLREYGENAIAEQKTNLWLVFFHKLWGPVPWMLEVSIFLELLLGKSIEAGLIGALVIFNAIMSTLQESRATGALALLRKRLIVSARVLRNGQWQMIPSSNLVPGDAVYLRMGDLIPADIELHSGEILVDQSTLTGESLPIEAEAGNSVYAGTIVRRGEARGWVTSTGVHTRYGKTAELVRLAKTRGRLEKVVFSIAKHLVILDAILVMLILIYAVTFGLPMEDILPFALILLVASVPVALPATFTVATALGALELAKNGVLVTRLNAIEEAASMQILCMDKTGTLTENRLEVSQVTAFSPYTVKEVIHLAAMASDDATQDPLDMAILKKARQEDPASGSLIQNRQKFIPFDPTTKCSEAIFSNQGKILRVMKGAPKVIKMFDDRLNGRFTREVEALTGEGYRVLAIASGDEQGIEIAGLVALQDPIRLDSTNLIARLRNLGVKTIMVTGDGLLTAKAVAAKIGIGENACYQQDSLDDGCEVYAEVLPEDKFKLVRKYQQAGYIVGMTGDGVNDAPALKQAEVGVAVDNATDIAKAAASLVLTSPGLGSLVTAIETSRRIYQRMLTYTLNKIIKTIEIAFFLTLGLVFSHTFVTTPLLMVLLLFTNDFVTMTISTDRVKPSQAPNLWNMRSIIWGAVFIAVPILALSFAIFWYAEVILQLPLEQLQTLLFVMLVYSGQGTIYLVRERGHFWRSRPSKWMLIGTGLDLLLVGIFASRGILMASIPACLVLGLLLVITVYLILLDFVKVPIFSRLNLN